MYWRSGNAASFVLIWEGSFAVLGFGGFTESRQENVGMAPRLSHDRFLYTAFQFIIYQFRAV